MRCFGSTVLLLLAACSDVSDPTPDASGETCAVASDCGDDRFCNGPERCDPTDPNADARGCVAGSAPCAAGVSCDEAGDRCETDCGSAPDADGDGEDAIECGGGDCDDSDGAIHPGATEVCDDEGRDEDCDPTTFGDRDVDGDGYVDAICCNDTRCGDDCDDSSAGVHPTEAEECDGADQDCDGSVDEGAVAVFVVDADGDGHGTTEPGAETTMGCDPPAGFALAADDCDDTDGSIHPGAFDRCDAEAVDDDCSGTPNDPPGGCECSTGDSRTCPYPGACAASTQTCVAGVWGACGVAPSAEICANGIDEDCDGAADDGCTCDEAFRVCGSDIGECVRGVQRCTLEGWGPCVDEVPASPEVCNGADDDCDGGVDEGLTRTCWADLDGDGFAWTSAAAMEVCGPCPGGTTAREPADAATQDCDDGNRNAYPGQTAFFIGPRADGTFDYDCDGNVITESTASSCATAADGSCVHDEYYAASTLDCGDQVAVVYCWAEGGTCGEVAGCSPSPGSGCHTLACR